MKYLLIHTLDDQGKVAPARFKALIDNKTIVGCIAATFEEGKCVIDQKTRDEITKYVKLFKRLNVIWICHGDINGGNPLTPECYTIKSKHMCEILTPLRPKVIIFGVCGAGKWVKRCILNFRSAFSASGTDVMVIAPHQNILGFAINGEITNYFYNRPLHVFKCTQICSGPITETVKKEAARDRERVKKSDYFSHHEAPF